MRYRLQPQRPRVRAGGGEAGRLDSNAVRLAQVRRDGRLSLAVKTDAGWVEAPGTLAEVAANGIESPAGQPLENPDFGPLLDGPAKIICVGRNYREHVSEMGNDESPWPETFLRLPSTVTGPYDEIRLPAQ